MRDFGLFHRTNCFVIFNFGWNASVHILLSFFIRANFAAADFAFCRGDNISTILGQMNSVFCLVFTQGDYRNFVLGIQNHFSTFVVLVE